MRKLEVDLLKCQLNNITPDDYVLLFLMHFKDFKKIEGLFGREKALELRKNLIDTKYIISKEEVPFISTILSRHVKDLLDIQNIDYIFWDWYKIYPHKVQDRILRSVGQGTKKAKDHEKSYRKQVKSVEEHLEICKRTKQFVEMKRKASSLQYLPAIDTVINGRLWEEWVDLAPKHDIPWNHRSI